MTGKEKFICHFTDAAFNGIGTEKPLSKLIVSLGRE